MFGLSHCSTLSEVSHVIMDEVHERNITSDFLTIIMRDLLPKRYDLRVYGSNSPMLPMHRTACLIGMGTVWPVTYGSHIM